MRWDFYISSCLIVIKWLGPRQYSRLHFDYYLSIALVHLLNLLAFTDCQMGSKVSWVYKPVINDHDYRHRVAYQMLLKTHTNHIVDKHTPFEI